MTFPASVVIREVAPRDGLQSEQQAIAPADRARLVELLADAGLPQINAVSFVSPKALPQMAGAAEVMSAVRRRPGVVYDASVPNMTGAQVAVAAGVDAVSVFVSASNAGSLRNVRRTAEEALAEAEQVCQFVSGSGLAVIGTIANAFGSPYDGEIPLDAVLAIARRLVAAGAGTISLGDTTGEAGPLQVAASVERLRAELDGTTIALHLHDSRGMALTNAYAALRAGVTHLDAAVGGIGGSPFSANAAGNLATEELVLLCAECGVATGVDLDALLEAYRVLEERLGHPLAGTVGRLGPSKRVTVSA
jgi:hydroxymethylglutaryl-CoA lyase